MEKNITVREALKGAAEKLKAAGVDGAGAEAEFLLTHLLGIKRHKLFLDPGRALTAEESSCLDSFLNRRAAREPAQYITGQAEFRGLPFKVTRAVLIPRPETELLVDEALKAAGRFEGGGKTVTAIDLCTGSGCIAVSLAKELQGCRVKATDVSAKALAVARGNAGSNGVAERIEFLEGDLFEPLAGVRAHLILSNPPYVTARDMEELEPEVADWEPRAALYGGQDGLDFYRMIISGAPAHLLPGGFLIMEMGFGQAGAVRGLLAGDGKFTGIETAKDYAGIDRVVKARLRVPEKNLGNRRINRT